MRINHSEFIATARKIAEPLNGKIIVVALSPREILDNVENLLRRLNQLQLRDGACEYLEEHDADRLLELSGELRQASELLFDAVHNNWQASAEETLALACKY